MKCILFQITVLVFACGVVFAQASTNTPPVSALDEFMETGMEVAGIRAPFYDDEGVLKAELHGEQARVLEDGRVDVSNLRIDVYEDGQVTMTLFAPQCFAVTDESGGSKGITAYSEGDVLISMDQVTIAGRGFRFSSESSRFEILNDSRVLLQGVSREMRRLDQ